MAIHNWIRCHWRNGRHVLHDVSETWHEEIEAHLRANRARTRDLGKVRTASLDSLEVAWVECEVALGSPAGDLTYRRARAVHLLARSRGDDGRWTRAEAERLLTERYGESADRGIAHQHRVLTRLSYPEDVDQAAGLWVGADAPLPSQLDEDDAFRAATGEMGYANRHLVDAWEEWVAEGRGAGPHAGPPPSALLHVAEPLALPEPPRATPEPTEVRLAPLPPLPPQPDPVPDRLPEAHDAVPDRLPEAHDATHAEMDADAPLFDLSRARRDPGEAPAASLSGLLGPTCTTPQA